MSKTTTERLLQAMNEYARAKWKYEESFGGRSEAWRRPGLHDALMQSVAMVEHLLGEFVDERIAASLPQENPEGKTR